MTRRQSSPKGWIRSTFPTKTVAGVTVVYNSESYKTQYYSVEWLTEAFGEHIVAAEDPRQKLAEQCERHGYSELRELFAVTTP